MKNLFLLTTALFCTFVNSAYSQPLYNWSLNAGPTCVNSADATQIAIDSADNVYVTGDFNGTMDIDPGPANTVNLVSKGSQDIYLARFDRTGSFKWGFSIGTSNSESGYDVVVGDSGSVYITGRFYSTKIDFDPGPDSSFLFGSSTNNRAFLAKYDSSGNFKWAYQLGGPIGLSEGNDLDIDSSGVFVTGRFSGSGSVDFDPGPGTAYLTSAGSGDAFLAKYDFNGNYLRATRFGGAGNDEGIRLRRDSLGYIWVAGAFQLTADFDPGPGTATLTSAGNTDCFVARFDSMLNYKWALKIGGTSGDYMRAVDVDRKGNCYITGSFFGSNIDFDPGAGSAPLSSAGGADIFLASYDSSGKYRWAHRFGGSANLTASDRGEDVFILNEDLYLAGHFEGANIDFDPGNGTAPLSMNGGNGYDLLVAKYDTAGAYKWAFRAGAMAEDWAYAVEAAPSGKLFVGGSFRGVVDFDPSPTGLANDTAIGVADLFVAKYSCYIPSAISPTACASYISPSGNYTWATTGTYTDVLYDLMGCDSLITVNLTIPVVDTSISVTSNTLTANASGATYQWLDCNAGLSVIGGANGQTYVSGASGIFALEITVNGCTDTSACYSVNTSGLNGAGLPSKVNIWPNPSEGIYFIDMGLVSAEVPYEVLDISGRTISRGFLNKKQNKIDLTGAMGGIYVLKISNRVLRLVKE